MGEMTESVVLKRTPLYSLHVKAGATMVPFGGWEMPVYYTTVIDEHMATRKNAGLFDCSHMGEFLISGIGAREFLQKMTVNDVSKLAPGKSHYSVLCNEQGGVIDDIFVFMVSENEYYMVVNASTIEKDFSWLSRHKPANVTLKDLSEETGKIDLQGPASEKILRDVCASTLSSLSRFSFVSTTVGGVGVMLSRTGYTGEDGFEIFCHAGQTAQLWNLFVSRGAVCAGLGARDTLRLESCYSLYGHELSDEITPVEAGIGWAVKESKPHFIGCEILRKQKQEGCARMSVAFRMEDRSIARDHYDVFAGGRKIGTVTSGTFSPTFGQSVGMALIDRDYAIVGTSVDIVIRAKPHAATIVKKPFYHYREGEGK